ncbi:MAG: alpha/beta hydrolase, partial [Oscillospiraceae bacterium]|nr:alpha/beta hydrolase [Oscillospiraceae bacterium]
MQIQVNHIDLAYEQAGSGPPLLLLHGNGEDHHIFDELSQKLQAQFTVYALDSRAHGQSSGNPADLSYELMARDVSAFIYQLQLAPVYLAGFSDGAILGLLLALRHPDCLRRLALMGVNLSPADFTAENLAALQNDYAQNGDPLLRLMLQEPDLSLSQVQQVTVPTLVIAAEHDIFKPETFIQLARALPDARLKIIPGADHSSYVVHQTLLYPELLDFFTEWPAAVALPPLGPPGCLDSKSAWEAWRPQLLDIFQDQLYGRLPPVPLETDLKLLPEQYDSFGGKARSQDAILRFRTGKLEY